MTTNKSFYSEKEMSEYFENYVGRINRSSNIFIHKECKSLFGIPDYVIVERNNSTFSFIISIELKIKNWKRALVQAFRYKSFSNLVFVIIDEKFLKNAEKHIELFKKFNIGLASFNKNKNLKIIYLPTYDIPYSDHFLNDFTKTLDEDNKSRRYKFKNNSNLPNLLNRFVI